MKILIINENHFFYREINTWIYYKYTINYSLINKYSFDNYLLPLEHIFYYSNAILINRDYFFLRKTKLYDYIHFAFLKQCKYNINTFINFSYRSYYSKEIWKHLLEHCGSDAVKFLPKKYLTKEMNKFINIK